MLVVVGVLAVVVAGALALAATRGDSGPSSTPTVRSSPGPASPAPSTLTAEQASTAFLDQYVDPDGRVVRRDQGGDTVSEGQAYAMLIAVGSGDQATFNSVWGWTRTNLLQTDGLLAWRWADGAVADPSSAADADLDAARALVLAGDRFSDPSLTAAGVTLGTAILDRETVVTDLGRIMVAGSWALDQEPYAYNPSYSSPAAVQILLRASKDQRWAELARGDRAATTAVLKATDLPPDWAQIHTDGSVDAMPGAAGRGNEGVRYSYDATRTPIRFAESCSASDVALAAKMKTAIDRFPGNSATRDLGGKPLSTDESVVAAVANAAIMAAAGDEESASAALAAADELQQRGPTYYGGAWDALGRLMLTSDSLGGCPPVNR